MGKLIWKGFQKSVEGMPQGAGIIMGRNLRSYRKPDDTIASDEVSGRAKEKKPNKE